MKRELIKIAGSTMVAMLVLIPAWQSAVAVESEKYLFRPDYETRDTRLTLSGVGVLRYLGMFSIYDGALYLPPGVDGKQALGDVAKRLEVLYKRPLKAEDFGPATITGIMKNVDAETYRRLESRINRHNALYTDIATGDRVALTYIPSVGTTLEINGKARGTIEGADFASALFSMWLGEKPFDTVFKRALLGGKR